MRGLLSIIVLGVATATIAPTFAQKPTFAQNVPGSSNPNDPAANAATNSAPSDNNTQKQSQPQGETGPTNTTSGGAPASSPQGDTPAGMQPIPQGSDKANAPKK